MNQITCERALDEELGVPPAAEYIFNESGSLIWEAMIFLALAVSPALK